MAEEISFQAIAKYLPAVKYVVNCLELEFYRAPALDQQEYVLFGPFDDEYSPRQLGYSKTILSHWLRGTPFTVDHFCFRRKDKADWNTMVTILRSKIAEYDYDRVIEILIAPSGTVSREVAGEIFSHDMEKSGMKVSIIKLLHEAGDFVPTDVLRHATHSKSDESILKTVAKINDTLRLHLHLPVIYPVIDTKRGIGHRIHPAYNVIFPKKANLPRT